LEHGRNAYVKNELFYTQISKENSERRVFALKEDSSDHHINVSLKDIKIPHENILSKHDVWMQQ
jgi:hypothetical protein